MSSDLPSQVQQLGRSMVQVNLRLNRVLEILEAQRAPEGAEGSDLRDVLLDLVDALSLAATVPQPRGWLARWRTDTGVELRRGVAMAREAALAGLSAKNIEPIPTDGAFDADLHQVVERVATADKAQHHTIAREIRPGWIERRGDGRRVLRPALVSVYTES